jgi:hypothetical protein
MGLVLSAYDPELDRKVAIKLIRPEADDHEARARLLREAHAMARVSHPSILPIFDVGVHEGRVFLAMEHVQGGSLREWLEAERRPWQDVRDAFVAAGGGLAEAHAAGLVHRDFKPDNVLMDDNGRVFVADFGLARRLQDEVTEVEESQPSAVFGGALATPLTVAGSLLGTPLYMSPEQLRGKPADAKSDQFSYCVAMWEALAGRRPFPGDNLVDIAANIKAQRIVRPSSSREGEDEFVPTGAKEPSGRVPAWIWPLLERGLASDPNARWPALGDLLVALSGQQVRRRRRRIAFGAGALGLAGIAGGLVVQDRRELARCEELGEEVTANVWSAAAQREAQAAFAATETAFATESWRRVGSRLDRFAGDWHKSRAELCVGQLRHSGVPGHLTTRSERCLDGALQQLAGLVEVLSSADSQVIAAAEVAALGLPTPSWCLEPEYLETLPSRESDQPQERELWSAIARAKGLQQGGRYESAREQVDDVFAKLGERGRRDSSLGAATLLQVGQLEAATGKLTDAVDVLRDAYLTAGRHSEDRIAAAAATAVTVHLAELRTDLDLADFWAEQADMWTSRLATHGDELMFRLLDAKGQLALARGDYDSAKDHDEARLAIADRAQPVRNDWRADALVSLVNVLSLQGESTAAAGVADEAVSAVELAFGVGHPDVVAALGMRANTMMRQGDLEGAAKEFNRSLDVLRGAGQEAGRKAAMVNLNLSAAYLGLGRMDDAREAVSAGIEIASKLEGKDSYLLARAQEQAGNIEFAAGDLDAGLTLLRESLQSQRDLEGDDPLEEVRAMANLADALLIAGRNEDALRGFRDALAVAEARGITEERWAIIARFGIGKTLLQLDRNQEAVVEIEASYEAIRKIDAGAVFEADIQGELAIALDAVSADEQRVIKTAQSAISSYRSAGTAGEAGAKRLEDWLASRGSPPPGGE